MRKKKYIPVDYSSRQLDRKRLAKYLRSGNFKRLSASPIFSMAIQRRRTVLVLMASIFIITGIYFVVF